MKLHIHVPCTISLVLAPFLALMEDVHVVSVSNYPIQYLRILFRTQQLLHRTFFVQTKQIKQHKTQLCQETFENSKSPDKEYNNLHLGSASQQTQK